MLSKEQAEALRQIGLEDLATEVEKWPSDSITDEIARSLIGQMRLFQETAVKIINAQNAGEPAPNRIVVALWIRSYLQQSEIYASMKMLGTLRDGGGI
jgi:hypothetical protein